MQFITVVRILGLLLMVFGLTLLPPWLVGWLMGDADLVPFEVSFMFTFALGALCWFPLRRFRSELKLRDGLLIVVLFWVVLGVIGALPIYLQPSLGLDFTQAMFESFSGITTTGATVLTGLDDLPRSLLFYRQQLQWLGGLGIIVLVVAFLPLLGVGGMQLYKAEISGPMKDNRLSGRISETAKLLWLVYAGLTLLCALLFKMEGMSWFDAVGHSFSTLATGGFSTHDASFGYFNDPTMEFTAVLFMLLGATPMALHYVALRQLSLKAYLKSSEFKFFFVLLAALFAVMSVVLFVELPRSSWLHDFRWALFNLVSFITTTGFAITDHTTWPTFLPVLLVTTALIGGCAGSTAGGLKAIRLLLLTRQGLNELRKLVHPHAEFVVKMGGRPLDTQVISAVWAFFVAYVFVFVMIFFGMMITGLDMESAFGGAVATLTSLGPGLGTVTSNFASVGNGTLWVGIVGMVLGRLEIFTVLVLFLPMFWRR